MNQPAPKLSFADHVASRLSEPAAEGVQRYLVIDQAAMHGVNPVGDLRWKGPAIDILRQQPADWDSGASPVLLTAGVNAQTQWEVRAWQRFAHNWRYANALTYVEAALAPTALAKALLASTRATLPERLTIALRWYDNRVLAVLLTVLEPLQRAQLLGGFSHCAAATRAGDTHVIELDTLKTQGRSFESLTLSQSQEATLLEASEPDALIGLLLDQGHARLIELLPPQQYASIDALWRLARGYGITQISDQAAFCSLGLELGAEFHTQTPWSEAVQAAQQDQGRFCKALQRMHGVSA